MATSRPDSAPLRIPIRVKPGASRASVGGAYAGPRGSALVVSVTARAVDGKATEAALVAVARALGVRRSAVRLHSGERSRDKVLEVTAGDAATEAEVTRCWHTLLGR